MNYFSDFGPLLENYADLIRLAFYDSEFYAPSLIDLALMPPQEMQDAYFSSFRSRVNEEYRREVRDGHSLSVLTQVEPRVRGLIEEELLQEASASAEAVDVAQ